MTTRNDVTSIREEAIALRMAGKSRREIKELLGPVSNQTLDDALRGTPPPEWTRRPNAKDDLREAARELRTQGLSYNEIAARLDVAKSSVSLWVRDIPRPERFNYVANARRYEGLRRYFDSQREARAAEVAASATEVGDLTDREILIAGAVTYWCEGRKTKSYRRDSDRVLFFNSDPRLIGFFLKFLDTAGVARDDLIFTMQIHETADVEAAQRFWLEFTGASPLQFRVPTLKRHNPRTNRKNQGDDYHGCLRVEVRRSSHLYRKIQGWASAAMAAG